MEKYYDKVCASTHSRVREMIDSFETNVENPESLMVAVSHETNPLRNRMQIRSRDFH